ncbi:radical SAM protein, partial [Candidatus Micrarchaeota archaeon]|nr:radical SAM protein [Candidatus Micrarchaeota archaeon]
MTVHIDLATNKGTACNNNCIFCAPGPRQNSIKPEEDTLRVKSELYKNRCKKQKGVLFDCNGGEPTTRSDIIEILSYAKELGYKEIQLQTNGRMFCYPEFTKKVVDAG